MVDHQPPGPITGPAPIGVAWCDRAPIFTYREAVRSATWSVPERRPGTGPARPACALDAPSPMATRGDQRSIAAPTISAPSRVVPIEPSVYRLISRPRISAGECCWINACMLVPYHTTAKPKYGIAARNTMPVGDSATQASELPRQSAAMPAVRKVGLPDAASQEDASCEGGHRIDALARAEQASAGRRSGSRWTQKRSGS